MSDAPAKMPARLAAREVAGALARAGFRALFAGGCVRDHLMGREPADFDIATDATPEQIKTVFPKARGVGEAFGVMLVRHAGHTFEVATFRKDGPYQDGRRPTSVTFSGEVEDAHRRDFTVNGIFEEPESGTPVDHVGGSADISARVIRAIGDFLNIQAHACVGGKSVGACQRATATGRGGRGWWGGGPGGPDQRAAGGATVEAAARGWPPIRSPP